jgi:hypothetical protein
MANKRNLKKQIRYICGDLAGECIIAREILPGVDTGKVNDIIIAIADLQADTLEKISFVYDKSYREFENVHEYRVARNAYYKTAYKTLIAEFNAKVDAILKDMNGLLSPEQREANKQQAKAK